MRCASGAVTARSRSCTAQPLRALACALLAVAVASGCSASRLGGTDLVGGKALDEASAQALGQVIESRKAELHGLSGTASCRSRSTSGATARRCATGCAPRRRSSSRRPSSFRLEALSPFGVTYAVASDGHELAILIPSERAVYRGQATAPTIGVATGVAASATEVAAVLLGLPPVPKLSLGSAWVSTGAKPASPTGDLPGEIEPTILLHAYSADAPATPS